MANTYRKHGVRLIFFVICYTLLNQPLLAENLTPWPTFISNLTTGTSASKNLATLPSDTHIIEPNSNLDRSLIRWSGTWTGWACINYSCDVILAIERLDSQSATIVHGFAGLGSPKSERLSAHWRNNELVSDNDSNNKISLRLRQNGEMEYLAFNGNGNFVAGILTKSTLPINSPSIINDIRSKNQISSEPKLHSDIIVPSNGIALPGLKVFDIEMLNLLKDWNIPGATLAVAKDGKLALSKGYGYSDLDNMSQMSEKTYTRVGSITKTLTSVAILRLVEQKRIRLDDFVLPILYTGGFKPKKLGDARSSSITIRNLLQHTGGWDRIKSGDPVFMPLLKDISSRQDVSPVTCAAITVDAFEQPLDFLPGSKFVYSNVGYCILGKVIESITKESFADYVSREIVIPAIGKRYRTGKSTEKSIDETIYHSTGQKYVMAAPGISSLWGVAAPYGSYSLENMEAFGAWVATPTEVLRFFLSIDGTIGSPLLTDSSLSEMLKRPNYSDLPSLGNFYYGLGMSVAEVGNNKNWFHGGSQPGVECNALRSSIGYSWVICFNSRPPTDYKPNHNFQIDFGRAIWRSINSISNWPDGDLF